MDGATELMDGGWMLGCWGVRAPPRQLAKGLILRARSIPDTS
jgi:hypothetical protein